LKRSRKERRDRDPVGPKTRKCDTTKRGIKKKDFADGGKPARLNQRKKEGRREKPFSNYACKFQSAKKETAEKIIGKRKRTGP